MWTGIIEVDAGEAGGTFYFGAHWESATSYSHGEYWGRVDDYAQEASRSTLRGTITVGDHVGGAFEAWVEDGQPDRVWLATYPLDMVPTEWRPSSERLSAMDGRDLGALREGDLEVEPGKKHKRIQE